MPYSFTFSFAWSANPEPDVNDYHLYAGNQSGVYNDPGSPKSMGNVVTGTYDVATPGTKFFALKAVNTSLLESADFSNELQGVATTSPIVPIRSFACAS